MHDFWCECLWTGKYWEKNALDVVLREICSKNYLMSPAPWAALCQLSAEEYYPPALLTRLPQLWRGPAMVCHVATFGVACFQKHQDRGLPKTLITTYICHMYKNYKIHNSMKRYVKYVFATTLHRLRDMGVCFKIGGPLLTLIDLIQGSVASIGFFMALSWPYWKSFFDKNSLRFPFLHSPTLALRCLEDGSLCLWLDSWGDEFSWPHATPFSLKT